MKLMYEETGVGGVGTTWVLPAWLRPNDKTKTRPAPVVSTRVCMHGFLNCLLCRWYDGMSESEYIMRQR